MKMDVSRQIALPADEVFAFFADATNNPLWQEGMESCSWTSEPPIGVGSTYDQRARFLGREVISTFAVTRFEPGELIAIETIKSTFPISVVRRVETLGPNSCRVSAEISGGPEKGFMKLLERLMAVAARRSIDRDYDRLVQVLEDSTSSDSTENSPGS